MFQKLRLLAVRFKSWISKIRRGVLGVVIGCLIGGQLNMWIINHSTDFIPAPEGADVKTVEGLNKSIYLFEPKHFLMPFLAHALGTLVAAFLAGLIANHARKRVAMFPGVLFFIGGAAAVSMIPAPMWFNVTDLVCAYIPMAMLGYWLSTQVIAEAV